MRQGDKRGSGKSGISRVDRQRTVRLARVMTGLQTLQETASGRFRSLASLQQLTEHQATQDPSYEEVRAACNRVDPLSKIQIPWKLIEDLATRSAELSEGLIENFGTFSGLEIFDSSTDCS